MKIFISKGKPLVILFLVANTVFLIGLSLFLNKTAIPFSRVVLLISAVLNMYFYICLLSYFIKRFLLK